MKRLLLPIAVVLGGQAAFATTPPTVFDNSNTYPLGSRAAAMGGAYTALACDEAAIHYNPAALACASASRLELAANAYVLQGLAIPDALGVGEDVSATNYHSLPAIVGGARVLREGDPAHGSAGRWVWGLSVTVPRSLALRVAPNEPTRASGLSYSGRDTIIAGDLGTGYQLTSWLAVGVSVGGGLRTSDAHLIELLTADQPDCDQLGCSQHVSLAQEIQASAIGLRGRFGARATLPAGVTLGFSFTTPALHVWGDYSETDNTTFAVRDDAGQIFYGEVVTRIQGTSELGLPGRATLGVAWSTPELTLSFDATLNLGRSIALARDLRALPVANSPTPTDLGELILERTAHPNFAIGAEYLVADGIVLDGGLYTDFSAVSDADFDAGNSDRVDMFGATFAIGFVGRQIRSWIGIAAAFGSGEAHVPDTQRTLEAALQGLDDERISGLTRWTLAGFIGSSYAFVSDD